MTLHEIQCYEGIGFLGLTPCILQEVIKYLHLQCTSNNPEGSEGTSLLPVDKLTVHQNTDDTMYNRNVQ